MFPTNFKLRGNLYFIQVNGAFHLLACRFNFLERVGGWGRKWLNLMWIKLPIITLYLNISVWVTPDRFSSVMVVFLNNETTPMIPRYFVLSERPLAAETTYCAFKWQLTLKWHFNCLHLFFNWEYFSFSTSQLLLMRPLQHFTQCSHLIVTWTYSLPFYCHFNIFVFV